MVPRWCRCWMFTKAAWCSMIESGGMLLGLEMQTCIEPAGLGSSVLILHPEPCMFYSSTVDRNPGLKIKWVQNKHLYLVSCFSSSSLLVCKFLLMSLICCHTHFAGTWKSWSRFWTLQCQDSSSERLHSLLQKWNPNCPAGSGNHGPSSPINSPAALVLRRWPISLCRFIWEIRIPFSTASSI